MRVGEFELVSGVTHRPQSRAVVMSRAFDILSLCPSCGVSACSSSLGAAPASRSAHPGTRRLPVSSATWETPVPTRPSRRWLRATVLPRMERPPCRGPGCLAAACGARRDSSAARHRSGRRARERARPAPAFRSRATSHPTAPTRDAVSVPKSVGSSASGLAEATLTPASRRRTARSRLAIHTGALSRARPFTSASAERAGFQRSASESELIASRSTATWPRAPQSWAEGPIPLRSG
jgi:hypothetical protein